MNYEWWKLVERFAAADTPVKLEFDKDYGASKRTGWSLTVNGIVCSQFKPTPAEAVECGLAHWMICDRS